MSFHTFPFVPLTWHTLLVCIASMTPTRVVVDRKGQAEYPDEWAHQLRHYKPSEHERYVIVQTKQVAFVHAVCPDTGRFLSKTPAWVIRPAPAAIVLETGNNDAFFWRLTDDDRLTFGRGLGRLTVRLFSDPNRGGELAPVIVYKSGHWDMETESRAMHLADRIAERLTIYRGQRKASGLPDYLPENISQVDDKGHAA